ncbi:MAG: ABC transporter ATP-binding protein [Thermoguttaceae bacterium]|nr:ABC transporter ATP-binding protein [Thermoguttaceae bacterium]MBQ6615125.1 ABC transporter ATP-binding protein [Thermoguttaceae bacterium]
MKKTILQIDNMSFGFTPNNFLLNHINLELFSGEVAVIAGDNGCGKSTLLQLILGKLTPCSGNIALYGKNPVKITRMPIVGVLSEPLHPVYGSIPTQLTGWEIFQWLSVLDNINEDVFLESLAKIGLSQDKLSRPVDTYSKGERQRFMTVVVTLRKPQLILADEPLEGLDSKSRQKLSLYLHQFAQQGGSVLWISHHLGEALEYANRFFVISDQGLHELSQNRYSATITNEHGESNAHSFTSILQLNSVIEKNIEESSKLEIILSVNKDE